jgi:uncharacterized membrane protein YdjX (TVP38/TMEM64 family)
MTRGRILILIVFIAAIALVFLTGVKDYLTLDALSDNRARLLEFVAANAVQAVVIYMAVYIAAVALSVPGAIWLTIAGGFIFGPIAATLYIVVAATIGATIIFLIARYVLGDMLRAKAGPALQKMEAGFQANALSYLLVLRLVPLFPFFLVNLVPAFLGVPLRTFIIGTFIGIIPGTFVYATVGAGLGDALDAGATVDPGAVLRQPTVIGALVGLALLALVPVIYRRMKSRAAG